MIELFLLGVSALLIILCGVFVAAEFALITVNRQKIEQRAEAGNARAASVLAATKTLSQQLSGAQVGITITNLAIGYLAEPAISNIIRSPLMNAGMTSEAAYGVSIVLGIAIATIATMLFGELIPKNLALARPVGTSEAVAGPQRLFTYVMKWPITGLNNMANWILGKFGVEPQDELASARSADELLSLVKRSAETGTLPKETALLVERTLSFGEMTANDIMTPRVRVRSVSETDSVADVLSIVRETGISRFPVVADERGLDDVMGMVNVKALIAVPYAERKKTTVRSVMKKAMFAPSTIQLESLLEQLEQGGMRMAVIVDEFGGTDGIVTVEDMLEEIVGDMEDEHDRPRDDVRRIGRGEWRVSGLLRPDEIAEVTGLALPEDEDFETVAGLISDRLEHVPKSGESVVVDAVARSGAGRRVRLTVQRMDGRRIDQVRMRVLSGEKESRL